MLKKLRMQKMQLISHMLLLQTIMKILTPKKGGKILYLAVQEEEDISLRLLTIMHLLKQ
jgi:hypothetical protein